MATNYLEWIKKALAACIPGDRAKGAKYVAEHPEEFGFKWGSGAVGKGVGPAYRELRDNAPHIEIPPTKLPLFMATWGPEKISDGLKGQSYKVACDRINRDTIEKAKATSNDVLKEMIVRSVLYGMVTRTVTERIVEKRTWVVNGTTYNTQEAYDAAMANVSVEETEKAKAFVDMAVARGQSMESALDMARTFFPNANYGEEGEGPAEEESEQE